ncbi:MAG: hypothetical protein RIR53_340 [Bacteroidota bacterium]
MNREYIALCGDSALIVLKINDLKNCRTAKLFRLPQEFDRCCIVNDSIVAAWTWRYESLKPVSNCHMVGLINMRTGHIRTVGIPFRDGIILSFDASFSCVVCVKQYVIAVDPIKGDIWALDATSTVSKFRMLESGSLRRSANELYSNPPDDQRPRDVSSLLKRLRDNREEDVQHIQSVHQVSDSILLVVKSSYLARDKKRGIDSVDAYVLAEDRIEPIARNLTNGYMESDKPCTREWYPISVSDGRIRTIGNRLINLTLQVPINECCNGVVPLSKHAECVSDKLGNYDKLPLMLVSYRLKSRRP